MCGIAGVLAPGRQRMPARAHARTTRMLACMAHRGPAGGAVHGVGAGALGANRLAIRSLRDSQPPLIAHPSGVVVACNGEIDNHRALRQQLGRRGHCFRLSTDVEVIAPLYLDYGEHFVEHLEGAFAVAIWDPRDASLTLARDRAGERHLYLAECEGTVSFATELAALHAGQDQAPEPCPAALHAFLHHGYCPAPSAPFTGFGKLGPGEVLRADAGGIRRRRYWRLPLRNTPAPPPTRERFDAVFREAVFRQSDIDVDYGILLSGGLDSSLIAAVARSVRPQQRPCAYGIRFAEHSYDESDDAAAMAAHLGCPFVAVTVSAHEVPAALQTLIACSGEPLADPAWIPLAQLARHAARDVPFVLGGEGADELFGGYPTYLGAGVASQFARLPPSLQRLVRAAIERLPVSDRKVTVSFLLKRFMQGIAAPPLERHRLWTASIAPSLLARLGIEAPPWPYTAPAEPVLDAVQRHDFEHALPEALLAKVDRGGMPHALEVRAPFLDPQVIDIAARLPAQARVSGLRTKVFLKHYAGLYLPRRVVHQRKRGLSVPLAAWLCGPLYGWARARLGGDRLGGAGVDPGAALQLLDEHRARRADHARPLWTLLVLAEWLDWQAGAAVRQDGTVAATPADPEGIHA